MMQIRAITQDEYEMITDHLLEIKTFITSLNKKEDIVYDNSDMVRLLKVSPRTLSTWRELGLISFSKIGSKIYYRKEDVLSFIEEAKVLKNSRP